MSMSGFCRRSLLQEYHSLNDDAKVAGSAWVAGWVRLSTRIVTRVGSQVLVWKEPEPRNVL